MACVRWEKRRPANGVWALGKAQACQWRVRWEKRRPANGVWALGSASDTSELRALKFLAQPVLKFVAGAV